MEQDMKLFKITLSVNDYDQFDSAIIVAPSKERIEHMVKAGMFDYEHHSHFNYDRFKGTEDFYIQNEQKVVGIEEIDLEKLDKVDVLCSSFNAG